MGTEERSFTEIKLRELSTRIANGDRSTSSLTSDLGSPGNSNVSCPQGITGLTGTDQEFWLKAPTLPLQSGSTFLRLWRRFPSSCRMFAYRILLWIGKQLYPAQTMFAQTTQRLPLNLFCKFRFVNKSEILATMFVAQHTNIPVPRILDVIDTKEGFFVLMTCLPGVPSQKAVTQMDNHSREIMRSDIHNWLCQLRSLPVPPSVAVSNFIGESSHQYRICSDTPIGPFSTVRELHDLILSHVWGEHRDQVLKTANYLSYSKCHRVCFTHGDLRPWNVLVHNGRLSGLVDFGSSGWFPEYWEHATATWNTPGWWKDMFLDIFDQYQDEIDVEDLVFSVASTHPEMW